MSRPWAIISPTRSWRSGHPLVAGVRGRGLLRGVILTDPVAARGRRMRRLTPGFIINAPRPDVLRLAPPLIISAAQLDSFVAALPGCLDAATEVPRHEPSATSWPTTTSARPSRRRSSTWPSAQGATRSRGGRSRARAVLRCIFDKPTLRTQISFAAGIAELGGFPMIVDAPLAGIGVRESVADTARVLGRQVAAIVWRTFAQDATSRRWPRTPASR